ncbi:class I SAM-dependent methyltransferase [Chloroflexus sp. Y-396-1]|uniref:class I SAM-dependent methyltransferase n=1 Tax=Chloroflexus sp. Y-396-1 TaxID=867845 RepID=UPI0004BC672F|nr:methyltransferase domain-containing protein [Chloroflexus sp. Y-396-1]
MSAHHQAVRAFYRQTDWMFRVLGWIRGSQAMHAGLWQQARSHRAALRSIDETLLATVNLKPGECLLDAGCGAGASANRIAASHQGPVIGITIVPEQAKRARRAGHAQFLCADYAAAPLRSGCCDVVWMLESICHAPDKPALLTEIVRLLRPGGRLIVADRFAARSSLTPAERHQLRTWLRPWAMPDLLTADELVVLAERAGLQLRQRNDLTLSAGPSLRFLGHFAQLTLPAALILHAMRLQSDLQIAAMRACIAQTRTLNAGLWRYYLLLFEKPAPESERYRLVSQMSILEKQ